MYEVTDEFRAKVEAEQAFYADRLDMVALDRLEAAEANYFARLGDARAKWKAVPDSLDKIQAEENANDTESTDIDELKWFRIAIATYEEIQSY